VLVFTRKRQEAIMIGDGIEVRVLRIGRDGVRLGVTAPTSISVHRREIYDQIRLENQQAATAIASAGALADTLRRAVARAGDAAQQQQAATPAAAPPLEQATAEHS
jgi:carbon storage regulator